MLFTNKESQVSLHHCKSCGSEVHIETKGTNMTCGVVGVIAIKNVHIFSGEVMCACGNRIYKEGEK